MWFGGLLLCIVISSSATGEDPLKNFAEANNAFAVDLYKHLTAGGRNVVFCPVCISSSLALLIEAGSDDKTKSELNQALRFKGSGLSPTELRNLFAELTERMQEPKDFGHFANGLFMQAEYEPSEDFRNDSRSLYNTDIRAVDFADNPQKATWIINEFVRLATQGKIKRLFERVESDNSLILVNVAHFRANVVGSPRNDHHPVMKAKFYNHGVQDHDLEVFMMERKETWHRVATSYDFRALELPCDEKDDKSNIRLWLFLPHKRGSLAAVEDGLSTSTFRQINESFQEVDIGVSIPRIRFDFTKDISKDLNVLGIRQAFTNGKNNFFGLSLSQVIQKAVIDFNEDSTIANTTSTTTSRSLPSKPRLRTAPPFIADHPFLFFIMDVQAGLILYMGRVYQF